MPTTSNKPSANGGNHLATEALPVTPTPQKRDPLAGPVGDALDEIRRKNGLAGPDIAHGIAHYGQLGPASYPAHPSVEMLAVVEEITAPNIARAILDAYASTVVSDPVEAKALRASAIFHITREDQRQTRR